MNYLKAANCEWNSINSAFHFFLPTPTSPIPNPPTSLPDIKQHDSPRHASPRRSSPTGHSPRPRDRDHSPRDSDDDDDSLSLQGNKSVSEIPSLMDLSVARPAASVSSPLLPTPKTPILPLVPPSSSSSQGVLSNRFRQSPKGRSSPGQGYNDPYDSPQGSGTICYLSFLTY